MTTNEHGETDACAMLMVSSLFFLPYCGPFVPLLPTALVDSHELLQVDLEMPLLLLFSFCCCWSVSITRRSVQKKKQIHATGAIVPSVLYHCMDQALLWQTWFQKSNS